MPSDLLAEELAAASPAGLAHVTSEGRWKPFEHLLKVDEYLLRVASGDITRLIIELPVRHGKALALDTPIPTPRGWSTVDDLCVGDYVLDWEGTPTRVVAKSPVWTNRDCYAVCTDDGDRIVADAEHEWHVILDARCPAHDHTTEHLAARRGQAPIVELASPKACVSPDRDLPIRPYTLGVWLGDGTAAHATITAGDDDREEIRSYIHDDGYETTDRATHATFGVLGIQAQLRKLGLLGDKHIPPEYLRAGVGQRRQLLWGLIDSDGYVSPDGQIEFCSTNRSLAEGARELVCSLGHKASLIEGRATWEGRDCGLKYRVMFYMGNAARLRRKNLRTRGGIRAQRRYLTFERAPRQSTQCIQVESPQGLFLAGRSMTPTHNSELVSHYFPAWWLGRRPEDQVMLCSYNDNFARGWGRKARDTLAEVGPRIFGVAVAEQPAAADYWFVAGRGGVMAAAGVGGAITGKGADCLPGETLVTTEHGRMRIDDLAGLAERPRVRVFDGSYEPILAARQTTADELYEITTNSGHTLRATGRHRIFTFNRSYVRARDLNVADILCVHEGARNAETSITGIERTRTRDVAVYDLQVAGPSHFFADGVLVHNCLIIDDPVKNAEEANSEVYRDKVWDWWSSTAKTRLQPGGKVVLVMARWHEDDLSGRIQASQGSMEPWTVLRLPALAEENDPMGRAEGEALCPEMWPKNVLEGVRSENPYVFAALYQQSPAPAEGLIFKRDDFRNWEPAKTEDGRVVVYKLKGKEEATRYVSAENCVVFQTADIAASKKTTADWTVVSTWAATPQKDLILLDSERQHFETLHVGDFLMKVNDRHGRPPIWFETFGAGDVPYKQLSRSGYPVRALKVEQGTKNDKIARAGSAIAAYERHAVFHPAKGDFVGVFEEELATFPSGHDDQVDTVAYAAKLLPTVCVNPRIRLPRHETITGGIMGRSF